MSRQPWGDFWLVQFVRTIRAVLGIAFWLVALTGAFSPRLVSAQGEETDLTLTLVFGTGTGYHTLEPAQDNVAFLEVRNRGDQAIAGIRLSSVKPEKWTIALRPEKIDDLAPGGLKTVEVIIRPDAAAAERDYSFTIVAETSEFQRVQNTWVQVERPKGRWLWIGGIILLVVVAGLIVVFMRFERAERAGKNTGGQAHD